MEIFIKFITYCAWVFGSLSLISIILNTLANLYYNSKSNELERIQDLLKGCEKKFPINKYVVILLLSIIWVLSAK